MLRIKSWQETPASAAAAAFSVSTVEAAVTINRIDQIEDKQRPA
jgi:hypothetical protein